MVKILKAFKYQMVYWAMSNLFIVRAYSKYVFRKYYQHRYADIDTISGLNKKQIICTIDGRKSHYGGIADRLAGMISCYLIAKKYDIDFKIHFTHPCSLDNFLIPNQYDWTIDEKDIIYNEKKSAVVTFYIEKSFTHLESIVQNMLPHFQQIHIATNQYPPLDEYGAAFNHLFKPSDPLKNLLDYHLSEIGCNFISVTFRFQSSLGDFTEANCKALPKTVADALIQKCINQLTQIKEENHEITKILITSDSETFLNEAHKQDFVYTIAGKRYHLDFSGVKDAALYYNSFLDFLLLAKASKLYLVFNKGMYRSGFVYAASRVGNKPYCLIER